jgi:hypothetical protein
LKVVPERILARSRQRAMHPLVFSIKIEGWVGRLPSATAVLSSLESEQPVMGDDAGVQFKGSRRDPSG